MNRSEERLSNGRISARQAHLFDPSSLATGPNECWRIAGAQTDRRATDALWTVAMIRQTNLTSPTTVRLFSLLL
jgi:hypothetical protein